MTKFPEIFTALAAPFRKDQVRDREGSKGVKLYYVTARTVANRLDDVLGPENWRAEFTETRDGLRCRLWYRLPDDPEWNYKEDGGGRASMTDKSNNEKSAYAIAFKRASSMLLVGRYLYRDGFPDFIAERLNAPKRRPQREQPTEPAPEPVQSPAQAQAQARPAPEPARRNGPTTGRALFAWVKEQAAQHDVPLLKFLTGWSKLQGLPARMIDFDAHQVELAYAEACRKLSTMPANRRGDQYEEALAN